MKELSIEEKAKRYDEAIELVNSKWHYKNQPCVIDVSEIFPELKESEDERIRKAIHIYLDWLDGRKDYQPKGEYTIRDMIAWIEKQKEFVSADFDDVWETADCEELTAPLEKYSKDAIKKMCHAWYDKGIELERKSWLEKQGEQKSAKNILEAWKDMRLEVYQQASGNRHEPNYSDDTTKMFSLNDIDEIIEKMSKQPSKAQ